MIYKIPGDKSQKFEVLFHDNWHSKGEILMTPNNKKIEVLSETTLHYSKWYWKILNFITFKLFFNVRYTYICKLK